MSTLKRQRLQRALYACIRVKKTEAGEFSAQGLRLAGRAVSNATLRQLCEAGCLELEPTEQRCAGRDGIELCGPLCRSNRGTWTRLNLGVRTAKTR